MLGTMGGIGASFFCHPLDVVRVQMQVAQYSGTADAVMSIAQRGGLAELYAGISAAWLRQFTYGAGRLGIYSWLLDLDKKSRVEGDAPSFGTKILMGTGRGRRVHWFAFRAGARPNGCRQLYRRPGGAS